MGRRPLSRLSRPVTLAARVEELLRRAIREGRFPGPRLPPAVELADELGVSRETVRLAEEALEREGLVLKVRRRGTLIQPPALALRTRKPPVIGYLQTDYASPDGPEEVTSQMAGLMLQGATREAGRAGCRLAVRHAAPTEMDRALGELTAAGLRGVVFASFGEEKLVRRVLGLGLPAVLLDHELNVPRVGSIREDSLGGARRAVRHLAGLGHRRIAYAQWRLGDLNPWRLRGYREGLREARLPRRRRWELFTRLTEAGARGLAESLLSLRPRPTALLCFNNTLARLTVAELERRGVRVPKDLSVVGGGGEHVPDLACVQADWARMGREAVRMLLRAKGRDLEHVLVPATLRRGRTAGPTPPSARRE